MTRVDASGRFVYVPLWKKASVVEIDLQDPTKPALTRTFATEKNPQAIAFLDATWLVVANDLGETLSLVDRASGKVTPVPVDYDGSKSTYHSSMNYSVEEYARDVVHAIADICDEEKVPHPNIVSESGRAIVAHHSVLVVEAFGSIEKTPEAAPPPPLVPEVEEHVPAGLLALPALLRALLHHRVGGVLLARVAAPLAGVGAGLTDRVGERPDAGGDARGRRTHARAVLARPYRFQVLLLPVGDHTGAVRAAGGADPGAIVARLGALGEVLRVVGVLRLGGR